MDEEAGWWTTSGKIGISHEEGLMEWVDNNNKAPGPDDKRGIGNDVRLHLIIYYMHFLIWRSQNTVIIVTTVYISGYQPFLSNAPLNHH